ncbi:hypothetical protein EON63_20030 [archaeon]|nr:MAG: hypothetical protein EON63_20030 [archaeon]
MDLDMDSISIPVSALNCFDTLSILLLVPVFDLYLYPLLKRKGWGGAEDGGWSMLQKIGGGFAVAMLAMMVAAFVEIMRYGVCKIIWYTRLHGAWGKVCDVWEVVWCAQRIWHVFYDAIYLYRKRLAPPAGDYYDSSARDNITPCQSIDDYNPYRYQVSMGMGMGSGMGMGIGMGMAQVQGVCKCVWM